MAVERRPVWTPYTPTLSSICRASSRVGATTSARTGRVPRALGAGRRRWSSGSTKAAVLPVPVWAVPVRSRPVSTAGMAASWMGVGVR